MNQEFGVEVINVYELCRDRIVPSCSIYVTLRSPVERHQLRKYAVHEDRIDRKIICPVIRHHVRDRVFMDSRVWCISCPRDEVWVRITCDPKECFIEIRAYDVRPRPVYFRLRREFIVQQVEVCQPKTPHRTDRRSTALPSYIHLDRYSCTSHHQEIQSP